MLDVPMFPDMDREFRESEAADRKAAAERRRKKAVAEHRGSWVTCWPQWQGPEVGGLIEVGRCCVFSITHNDTRYHYCAPCRIREISEDGETFIVEVQYRPDSTCADRNGEMLRLDVLEVWAPVAQLIAERHRQP